MHRGVVERSGRAVAIGVVLVLLSLLPLVSALEIHHAFAAADHDGHQHSDSDLCQWVQHHTGTSLFTASPLAPLWLIVATYEPSPADSVLSTRLVPAGSPRGPPVS